jgi:HlyD family secretion protein
MAKPKKRRKIIIFGIIGLALVGLTTAAIFRKREVIVTVQTEKVTRRSITEIVSANGKIQPVLQVKISPEVSGEITDLPVKEGQCVQKGQLILKIKPDFYVAARNQAEANYKGSLAGQATAEANLRKAQAEFRRNEGLFQAKLISDSAFDEVKAAYDVAQAQLVSSEHQVEMTRASLTNSEVELAKTTIVSPLTGRVSKLDSQVGERVVGTATMAGTEVMTLADLNEMEARVDIGETDVNLIQPGQNVRLEVDAFKDRKFTGTVTDIADSARNNNPQLGTSSTSQEATKFEVKIRIKEKEAFRPGMSVTAEIETRSRTNVLTVPIASVTMRPPKEKDKKGQEKRAHKNGAKGTDKKTDGTLAAADPPVTNAPAAGTNADALASVTNVPGMDGTNSARADKKSKDALKPIEVVFVVEGDHAKMLPVKIGISDDSYWEITGGLQEAQEVVSGGYRAISRDLEDGKKIHRGPPPGEKEKAEEKGKG